MVSRCASAALAAACQGGRNVQTRGLCAVLVHGGPELSLPGLPPAKCLQSGWDLLSAAELSRVQREISKGCLEQFSVVWEGVAHLLSPNCDWQGTEEFQGRKPCQLVLYRMALWSPCKGMEFSPQRGCLASQIPPWTLFIANWYQ